MKFNVTANRLKKALNRSHMTARELSIKSGVSESSISQYITGTHKPGNVSAGKIAAVLDSDPLWLMGFDTNSRNTTSTKEMPDFGHKVLKGAGSMIISQPIEGMDPRDALVLYSGEISAFFGNDQMMNLLYAALHADPDQIEMAINLLNYKKENK